MGHSISHYLKQKISIIRLHRMAHKIAVLQNIGHRAARRFTLEFHQETNLKNNQYFSVRNERTNAPQKVIAMADKIFNDLFFSIT